MAHMIETMAYSGKKPWHGLGVPVHPYLTPDEMLDEAGLNWIVSKQKVMLESGQEIPNQYAIVRESDQKIYDIVGKNWNPLQNHEAFSFFDKFVKAGNMTMETAGSLDEGRRVWGLAKMKNADFSIANSNDEIESYMLFVLPHVYGESIQILYTPTRVVCNNTLTLALMEKDVEQCFKMRHTAVWDESTIGEAERVLGLSGEFMAEYKETGEFLASKKVTDESLNQYFATLFQPELLKTSNDSPVIENRVMKKMLESYEVQPGKELSNGTFWTAYNAVTYFLDHHAGHNQNNRVKNLMIGTSATKKRKALELAVNMAKAA